MHNVVVLDHIDNILGVLWTKRQFELDDVSKPTSNPLNLQLNVV